MNELTDDQREKLQWAAAFIKQNEFLLGNGTGTYGDLEKFEAIVSEWLPLYQQALERLNQAREALENKINWEQRRFDAALAAMRGLLSAPWHPEMGFSPDRTGETVTADALFIADLLIEKLKGAQTHGAE